VIGDQPNVFPAKWRELLRCQNVQPGLYASDAAPSPRPAANDGVLTATNSAARMVNRKIWDSTPASLLKWSPLRQPYNHTMILERAGRSRVESTMCVCYELMQTAGGHWGILADGGTPRPFFTSVFPF